MARPREFEIEDAVEGAMRIFWRQGFKATNLPELLAAMGLSRGSFYKAFDDKVSIYLAALDHYDRTVVSAAVAMLGACDDASASDCLARLFGSSDDARQGCFICNAMVELAPDNPQVAERTARMAARLREGILEVLTRYGTGPTDARRQEMADVILHLYFGHQAMGRSGRTNRDWRDSLARILG